MSTVHYNGGKDGLIHECDQIISFIERGSSVLKFYPRKRPERRSLYLRRETNQVIWFRSGAQRHSYEGAIDIREIKEVRVGKSSKDFERWPEETKRLENAKCFTIYYGSEFKMRSVSFALVTDEDETFAWVKGVRFLIEEEKNAPYPLQIERWLRKEFYAIENNHKKVTLKEVKAFLPKINCKISTSKLRDFFQEVDTGTKGEIGFDDFSTLYHKLIFDENNVHDLFDKYGQYCSNGTTISLREFQAFLRDEQNDPMGHDERRASEFIRDYLMDPQRNIIEPYFTLSEFIEMLFSKQNTVWDSRHEHVNEDLMKRPLSHYWISSSHNTYLTGDQFSSESSLEAYVRCLRAGCRCIELDCWDGPDGSPFIYHGHTLTTKIKFMDVLKTIKEHAFATSDYPLILSIEDNCSLPQQRRMASAFQEYFGDLLLVTPYKANETALPSPYDLRRKIILKHKKLPEGVEDNSFAIHMEDGKDLDLRNSIKNGILRLQDPVEKDWNKHVFVLTENKLYYTDYNTQGETDGESDGEPEPEVAMSVPQEELHFGECWFHGKLVGNRKEAEDLIRAHAHLGEGTFLVRESVTFVGDYCLSFWRNGQVNHCRIKVQNERGITKYCLIKSVCFDSLYSLITHYRQHSLRSQEFETLLTEPVPQPKKHEEKEWYHRQCSRAQAEELLRKTGTEVAFLVRPSEKDAGSYAISFRTGREIKHCRIKLEGRLYTIGTIKFESLVELVAYYEKHPLYKKVKLQNPISEHHIHSIIAEPDDTSMYGTAGYMDPSSFSSRGVIDSENAAAAMGTQQKGVVDLYDAGVELAVGEQGSAAPQWLIRIKSPSACAPFEMEAPTREIALEWFTAIKEAAQTASARSLQHKKMERTWRIAKEMSNLIVYCRSVAFNQDRIRSKNFIFNEMSSFPETKAERLMCQTETQLFLKYHTIQLSRIYPKGQRIDSSNYNPVPFWNAGSQMVALNYQTPDKPMQVNYGKFKENGNCGYILKPDFMFDEGYSTTDRRCIEKKVRPVTLKLRVIGARHLCKSGRGTANPFVEVELIGADYDAGVKLVTKTVGDNGINRVWNEICEFEVANPELALIRFLVQDEDMFGDPNFIGQATYPLKCLRTGYRSVILTNGYSEELELSSLLIHLAILHH
ncbi:1-phosphatidylinositol 4,5-bisphosphate phosphodiesterase gamma-1 isoform X2 [Plutella xylostella]|uniref:1-phosphatidylinositol 4,5-bisphosphate phosphodiesterase gamma-1 isoform X2 n=1 Tax=Plutella xylostella TaxID=51655 RepID=UPI0018D15EDD|nr:1-phosphatidylinositol 4,5-bisphosphate phosphodiesterase gamma-1 isoform X2 [Plutella xylostella]